MGASDDRTETGSTTTAGPRTPAESLQTASLLRRLAAMTYDSLLLLALLMIVTACFLPLTGGEAVRWQTFPLLTLLYWCALAGTVLVYFGLPWTARGQTLAMTTWRLRVKRDDGCLPTWRDVALRLAASVLSWLPAGLGFLWVLFNRERRAWHDSLSGTRIVVLPKRSRKAKPL
jgi:uncharacterized RDD family membrane protein YckC